MEKKIIAVAVVAVVAVVGVFLKFFGKKMLQCDKKILS